MIRLVTGILIAAVLCAGCISTVSVKPATASTGGLRYSLPAPYLLVTPAADGSASYTWVYLPDTRQQYVVNSKSFLAQSTLDVQTQNGLLKQVGQSLDATSVGAQALSTYAAIKAAEAAPAKTSTGGGSGNASGGGGTKGGGGAAQQSSQSSTGPSTQTTQTTTTDANGKSSTTMQTTTSQPTPSAPKNTSTGAIHKAFGPVLLKVVQNPDGGVFLIPVDFPGMKSHGFNNEIAEQTSTYQQYFETNTLTHTVTLSATDAVAGATSITIVANYPIAEITGVTLTADPSNSNPRFTSNLVSMSRDPKTPRLTVVKLDTALPKGIFHIHVVFRETASGPESTADAVLTVSGPP